MNLHLLHGWSFDAGFWSGVVELLSGARIQLFDRGYFHAPAPLRDDGPHVAITHSFGSMIALAAPSPQCLGMVAINGFDGFAARPDRPGVAPRVIDRMVARFDEAPAAVLDGFRLACKADAVAAVFDPLPLRQDLIALRDLDCRSASASWDKPILSIQSANDPIMPAAMRGKVFAGARQIERVEHPSGGHLLPRTDAEFCARHIRAFVDNLR